MSANFTPSMGEIKCTGMFKFWCQKVLPLVYDDSLSYYELLCKVVNYLNDVISNMDITNENVRKLYEAFISLQNYVNEYFDNLDVQEEINNKLDSMVADGSLITMLGEFDWFCCPEWFGAKGDGVNDDYEAIMNAIEYAYNNNKVVVFSPKTYVISQTILITKGNIKLMGSQFSNRGVTSPTLKINHISNPAIELLGSPASVEFGGTLENVTLDGISIDRVPAPASNSVGVRIRYAQFVSLRNFAISHANECVSFGNMNGLFIEHAYLSNDGVFDYPRALSKMNHEGMTGLRCFDVTYYTQNRNSVFCYDWTDGGQAGDRVFDKIEIAGSVYNVVNYKSNGGFSDHVFWSNISADNVVGPAFFIHNDNFNQFSSFNLVNCWVNLTDIAGSLLYADKYNNLVLENISINTSGGNYNIFYIEGCKQIGISNSMIKGNNSISQVANVINTVGLTVSNLISSLTGGTIWLNAGCDKCAFTGVILPEPINNSGTNFVKAGCIPA